MSTLDPLVAGGAAAILLKSLNLIEQFVQKRRNGSNGNGFTRDDHDTLARAAERQTTFYQNMQRGLDTLHDDMEDVKDLLRDKA